MCARETLGKKETSLSRVSLRESSLVTEEHYGWNKGFKEIVTIKRYKSRCKLLHGTLYIFHTCNAGGKRQ